MYKTPVHHHITQNWHSVLQTVTKFFKRFFPSSSKMNSPEIQQLNLVAQVSRRNWIHGFGKKALQLVLQPD
jgi:hypothetical protein